MIDEEDGEITCQYPVRDDTTIVYVVSFNLQFNSIAMPTILFLKNYQSLHFCASDQGRSL